MSEICELEDLNKECCVNCINGLPAYGCPIQESESKKLRELVHKRAEQIHKAEYDKGYQQGRADAIDEFCHWYFDMKNDAQINAVDDLIKRFNAEQLKEQKND